MKPNEKNRSTKRLLNYQKYLLVAFLIIIAGIIFFFIFLLKHNFLEVNNELTPIVEQTLYALFTTVISVILINVLYQYFAEKDLRESVKSSVIDSLSGEKHILKKISTDHIDELLQNILLFRLGNYLGGQFIDSVINRQINNASFRRGFSYDIHVGGNTEDQHHYILKQELSYKKYMKANTLKEIYCLFTFAEDPFCKEFLKGKTIFFREEITCHSLFEELLQADSTKVLNLLKFELSLFCKNNKKVTVTDNELLSVMVINTETLNEVKNPRVGNKNEYKKYAVVLRCKLPQGALQKDETFPDYTFFSAAVKCSYKTNKNDSFYCVFPEPTSDISFSIHFDRTIIDQENVRFQKFVSSPNYEVIRNANSNGLQFRSTDTSKKSAIFPHSGVIFYW